MNPPNRIPAKKAACSDKPLSQKLGIKEVSTVLLIGAPEGYAALVAPLPKGVRFVTRLSESTDIVHVFTSRRAELQELLAKFRPKLKPPSAVWVSWPKKSAKVPTDITEDTVRAVALPMGFVDIKVCAVNEVWSGLKLVIRKELRWERERLPYLPGRHLPCTTSRLNAPPPTARGILPA